MTSEEIKQIKDTRGTLGLLNAAREELSTIEHWIHFLRTGKYHKQFRSQIKYVHESLDNLQCFLEAAKPDHL